MQGNSIFFVEKCNIIKLETNQLTAEKIGGKALGLCQIPSAWSIPFFVISKEMFAEYILYEDKTIISEYMKNIESCVKALNLDGYIILRSSAVDEGMKERGKFDSIVTHVDDFEDALGKLLDKLKVIPNNGMPIIVQKLISSVFTGHMSNERRFSQENRDWKVEIYYENGRFEQDSIGIRTWRIKYDIREITKDTLNATPKTVITELQKVAYYWYKLSQKKKVRFHLEFVYDGKSIYIVQADQDFQKENTINPKSIDIRVKKNSEIWEPKVLKKFDPSEALNFKKLQNVKNYNDLGFCTVPFYLLDDSNILIDLQKGVVHEGLREDIETLLRIQSLVIRMDINYGDKVTKQMLPRSNEIQKYKDVIIWLKENVSIITKNKQEGIFIFHNFVPATSSAFAHAIPNGRLVKIQSLWGLPEGLYYNYHDTIIVDFGSKNLDSLILSDIKVTIKNKYKDIFIQPDKDGKWIACDIKEPYDWKCSIETNESIFEIATKSQKLANKLNEEISVMWFVGIDDSFYGAKNIPWFHEKVSIVSYTTDEYKRKYFEEEEVIINSSEKLQELISSSNIKDLKCIRLKPNCEKDLRNKELIANIGKMAVENDIIILLDGTQLTHSYYQLKTTGAKVVCSNKDELLYSDTFEFNKLVRDKIPDHIISNGEHVKCYVVVRPVFDRMLLEKLMEEAYEVNDAKTANDVISELADLTEICNTILKLNEISPIYCGDILNNKKPVYKNDFNRLAIFDFPIVDSMYGTTFKIEGLYGSILITRNKTMYRVEFNLQNYPTSNTEKKHLEDNLQIKKLKVAILTDVSLALNSKCSQNIINHINSVHYHINCLCETMGIPIEQVKLKRESKALKVGGFEKGYVLKQTTLKDNVINDVSEFNPATCSEMNIIEREYNKYFELLQDFEKNKRRLLFRFSVPIAVNQWELFFDNPQIRQILINFYIIQFEINKKESGQLILTVNAKSTEPEKQLSIFDL